MLSGGSFPLPIKKSSKLTYMYGQCMRRSRGDLVSFLSSPSSHTYTDLLITRPAPPTLQTVPLRDTCGGDPSTVLTPNLMNAVILEAVQLPLQPIQFFISCCD